MRDTLAATFNAKSTPRAYDLTMPDEMDRLLREVLGYLNTCRRQHHGTDRPGREFAQEALRTLTKGDWKIVVHPPED